MSDVINPIGSSNGGAIDLAAVSAISNISAPMRAATGINFLARGPTKLRAICGAASAKNEIVPTVVTAAATSSAKIRKALERIF